VVTGESLRLVCDLRDVRRAEPNAMVARLQVADQVRATVASTSSSVREDVMGALFTALAASGHKVFLCRAPGSGQPGQLCFTHTYMALQKGKAPLNTLRFSNPKHPARSLRMDAGLCADNTDGTSTLLLIEPTLRDEFHVRLPPGITTPITTLHVAG
jgi:hypothetical protein